MYKRQVLYDTNSVIRKHFSTKFTVQYKPGQAKLGEVCPPPDNNDFTKFVKKYTNLVGTNYKQFKLTIMNVKPQNFHAFYTSLKNLIFTLPKFLNILV